MRKITILLLCCGVLVSMVGCGGNTAPPPTESLPTTVSETVITEPPTETTPTVTAVEPTEKEKEPPPTKTQTSRVSRNLKPYKAKYERQVRDVCIKSAKTYGKAVTSQDSPMANERNTMYTLKQGKNAKS